MRTKPQVCRDTWQPLSPLVALKRKGVRRAIAPRRIKKKEKHTREAEAPSLRRRKKKQTKGQKPLRRGVVVLRMRHAGVWCRGGGGDALGVAFRARKGGGSRVGGRGT